MSEGPEDPVVVSEVGATGRIMLNRPATLNALTLEMVRLFDAALTRFEEDSEISAILVAGAGGRGLCAGGDIRSIYEAALSGDPSPRIFWAEEYRLNARIANYAKPIVAIMDGIVMGGGIGISAHASHRVVSERSILAMPEVGIGFAPDVGGTWLLSRAPGEIGTHIALSTERLGADDAIVAGLADFFVPGEHLEDLISAVATVDVDDAMERFSTVPPRGKLVTQRSWIDNCYSSNEVEEIVARLQSHSGDASLAAAEILSKSPTSLKVSLRSLHQARELKSLEQCLKMEYRISSSFLEEPDFVEGVRAAIIDKDRSPRWRPAQLENVKDIERFFSPRDDDLDIETKEGI